MLQLSKIKKSRDEWREKAKKRAEELWEMRKVHKYYKERLAKINEENRVLKEKLENLSSKSNCQKKIVL